MDPFEEIISAEQLDVVAPIRDFHGRDGLRASGRVTVTRGTGLAGTIAAGFGFPPAMNDRPMRLTVRREGDATIWDRDFDGFRLTSKVRRRNAHIVERFGPLTLTMSLSARDGALDVGLLRGAFLGVPMPRLFLPKSESREFDDAGRFGFDIRASLPGLGLLIRYRGWLLAES